MIYRKVKVGGRSISLYAQEDAEIKIRVNDRIVLSLPLVNFDNPTIQLTPAGLDLLERSKHFKCNDIEKVEFLDCDYEEV